MAKPKCRGKTKQGKRCSRFALDGQDFCIAHAPEDVKVSKGFGGKQPGAGRPPSPRAVDLLKDRIEQDIDIVLDPLWDALGAETLVWAGDRDAETVPDHKIRLAASRELLDRAYGRPKQATEISGPDGGAIPLAPPIDATDKSQKAALLLHGLGQLDAPG